MRWVFKQFDTTDMSYGEIARAMNDKRKPGSGRNGTSACLVRTCVDGRFSMRVDLGPHTHTRGREVVVRPVRYFDFAAHRHHIGIVERAFLRLT